MDQLQQIEQQLLREIDRVELLGELNLTVEMTEALGFAIKQLISQYDLSRATARLIRNYPVCFAAFLVAKGVYGYRKGDYWSSVEESIETTLMNWSAEWGKFFEQFVRERGLAFFPYLEGRRYVDQILLHGGIPDYCLNDFFEHLLWPALSRADWSGLSVEELIFEWIHFAGGRHFTDEPVLRFLRYGRKIAVDFVARCLDMAQSYAMHHVVPEAEDVGLPTRVVARFQEWVNTRADVNIASVQRLNMRLSRPIIWLDPWGGEIFLDLPAQVLSDLSQQPNAVWTIIADNREMATRRVFAQPIAQGWETESHRLTLQHPAAEYSVAFHDGRSIQRTWRFTGISNESPVVTFDAEDGRLVQWRRSLPARELWLLSRKDATFQVDGGIRLGTLPPLFAAWSDYAVAHWDLHRASALRLRRHTIPVEPDESRLRPYLEHPGLAFHFSNHVPACYVGDPPRMVIPFVTGRDPAQELGRWHVTISGPRDTFCAVALTDLSSTVEHRDDALIVSLDHPQLLGTNPFGIFRVSLRGPLGRDATFSLALVPELHLLGHEQVRIPDANGQYPHAGFTLKTSQRYAVDSPDDSVRIVTQQPGRHYIEVAADRSQAEIQLHDPDTGVTLPLHVPLPMIRWHVVEEQQSLVAPAQMSLTQPMAWLDQRQVARLVVNVAPTVGVSYTLSGALMLCSADGKTLQHVSPLRHTSKRELVFDLKSVTDTVRASREASVWFVLSLDGLPGHSEMIRIPVLRLTQQLAITNLVIKSARADDAWILTASWRDGRRIRHRYLRLWSLWRPWADPVDLPVPDEAEAQAQWHIPFCALPPGAYRCEMTVIDPWLAQEASRPDSNTAQTTDHVLGTPQECVAYLASLPDNSTGAFERALAADDTCVRLRALRMALADVPGQHIEIVLVALLFSAEQAFQDAILDDLRRLISRKPSEALVAAISLYHRSSQTVKAQLLSMLWNTSAGRVLDYYERRGYLTDDIVANYARANYFSPETLVTDLNAAEVQVRRIFGSDSSSIDQIEDRDGFAELIRDLPDWALRDSERVYLHEIGNFPLLSAEQERELALRIADGRDAERILASVIDPVLRDRLCDRVKQGKQAREFLINSNLRLVVSVAKRYLWKMPFLDLIQEGNIGLMRAVDRFDVSRGHKFSTYATWWIRQAIVRGIADKSRIIRLPLHLGERLGIIHSIQRQFTQEHGREPTSAELAQVMGMTEQKVQELLRVSQDLVSLDVPVGEDGETTLGDMLAHHDEDFAEIVAVNELRQRLAAVLAQLSERERRVLELRFGIHDGQTYTLEEIGCRFGITRERIRQIEVKALRKLKRLIDELSQLWITRYSA